MKLSVIFSKLLISLIGFGNIAFAEAEGAVIDLDLDVTHSFVGFRGGRVEVFSNSLGRIAPHYVSFTNEEVLAGDTAKDQAF